MMKPETQAKVRDVGLLMLRLGLGAMFVYWHGWEKLAGGLEKWAELGGAMEFVGITFWPTFWGFMAAFTGFFGGICFAFGIFFRPFCVLLTITMAVAAAMCLGMSKPPVPPSYPIEMGIVTFGLIFIGPGRLSLGRSIRWKRRKL